MIILRFTLVLLLFGSFNSIAQEKDDSTKVTATISLGKTLKSFADQTLEVRLYEYDPFLADAAATLIEKIEKPAAHTKGKATEWKIAVGAKGKIKVDRKYYITIFILEDGKRTHMGEKDGKRGMCNVLTAGNPRDVNIIVRSVR